MIREQWNEQAEAVERGFEQALAIATEAKGYFGDYLIIDSEHEVLNKQWSNWKRNRFEIVVVGEFSTGKSTFINALLRKNVLPSRVTPTTATINYIRHIKEGDGEEKAIITFVDGRKTESPFDQLEEYVTEMSREHNVVEEISFVDLFVDSPYLEEGVVIVDTPGLQALHPEHERITKDQIKRSSASILLFNMEQPGKRSEFMFLRDLSDSIERIFFVGNRMDGVPEDEISDVINVLESSLKDNEYRPIQREQAKVFPVSALQALKGRDESVKTKLWNDWSSENLMITSRFSDFEQRLEDYIFNGEKTKDLMQSPYRALHYFYNQLQEKINQIELLISGEISIEALQEEKQRLAEEVELRKLQLQDQERNLKNLFQEVLYEHEKSFNERKDEVMRYMIDQVKEVEFIDDLEDEVSNVMLHLNNDFQQLVDQGIIELSHQLEMKMRRELDGFEIRIEEYSKDTIKNITDKEIKVATDIKSSKWKKGFQLLEEKYAEEAAAIEENKNLLKKKKGYEQELESLKKYQEGMRNRQQREESFVDMMMDSTNATKKEYGVLKKRRFWFDKEGIVDVKNEDFDQLIKEKRELLKKSLSEDETFQEERSKIDRNIALQDSEFDTIDDYYEARRDLQKRKEADRVEKFREMTKLEERQLKKEQKKVIREIENIFENLRREYRSLLRGMDSLKLAQQGINNYIQEKDVELKTKLKDLQTKEKILDENAQKQKSYQEHVAKIHSKVEKENEMITNLLLEYY